MMLLWFQSGCCKPSNDCNYQYVSPTNWTSSATPTSQNPDCAKWSNDVNKLCYDCNSCKAGLLDNIKSDWKRVAEINIVFLVFLVIVYTVGCCAFRNNRDGHSWKWYTWLVERRGATSCFLLIFLDVYNVFFFLWVYNTPMLCFSYSITTLVLCTFHCAIILYV